MMKVVNAAPQRFSMGSAIPRIPKRMGEGTISTPKPSATAMSKLRSDVNAAILALDNSLEDVRIYAGLLAPNVLRADPNAYLAIPDIAESFSPAELRTIIADDAKVLGNIAQRIWTGAAGSYITGDQAQQLERLVAKANGIQAAVKAAGPLPGVSNLDLANDHQDVIAGKAGDLMTQIETDVVSAEAGSVPVLEPYEKTSEVIKVVVGTGIAAAVVFGLWSLLS